MDDTMHDHEGPGTHIWLRYATQYSWNGRNHTIEMSVPVPVGADAETRAQLFREAETGMRQLIGYVESHMPEIVQHTQKAQGTKTTQVMPGAPTTPPPAAGQAPSQRPPNRPAAVSAPQTSPQPSPTGQARATSPQPPVPRSEEVTVPPTRPSVGASMPHAPVPSGGGSGTIDLPQFISRIRDLGLTPKDAMKLLNVKSLSTGINHREALERLERLVAQGTTAAPTGETASTSSPKKEQEKRQNQEVQEKQEPAKTQKPETTAHANSSPTRPAPVPIIIPSDNHHTRAPIEDELLDIDDDQAVSDVREVRPAYRFDEEVDPDEPDELEDLDLSHEFSSQELARARDLVNSMREWRGPTTASAGRLQVLNNVVVSQISKEQLHTLIEGLWSVTQLKRLKVDQVEALISWGKEDNFVNEVEAVLSVLEEDHYARGNR